MAQVRIELVDNTRLEFEDAKLITKDAPGGGRCAVEVDGDIMWFDGIRACWSDEGQEYLVWYTPDGRMAGRIGAW